MGSGVEAGGAWGQAANCKAPRWCTCTPWESSIILTVLLYRLVLPLLGADTYDSADCR